MADSYPEILPAETAYLDGFDAGSDWLSADVRQRGFDSFRRQPACRIGAWKSGSGPICAS